MRSRWMSAAVIAAAAIAIVLQTSVIVRTGFLMGDFRAFYCAARVASHGADPYHTEPLRTCELDSGSMPFFKQHPRVTIPAPLPGYALAVIVPLTLLPFSVASVIWGLILLLGCIAATLSVARFAGVSWEIPFSVLGISLATLSLPFGEVVPIAVGCACGSGYFAWRGRYRTAALVAAGSMIEPHLGLPVCVALALWRPSTRLPLMIALAALSALSLGLLGLATNLEYFTSVLPSHALSELTRDTQYSLTVILSALGAPASAAVRGGTLWYFGMLAIGALTAGYLARKTGNDAFLACTPLVFAVFGGAFIHLTQIGAAIPAALLLVSYSAGAMKNVAIVALLTLSVPWGWVFSPGVMLAPAFPVGYVAWRYWGEKTTSVLLAVFVSALMVFGLNQLCATEGPRARIAAVLPPIDNRLPEASWSVFTQGAMHGSLATWAIRTPTWLALALLLALLAIRCRSERNAGVILSPSTSLGINSVERPA